MFVVRCYYFDFFNEGNNRFWNSWSLRYLIVNYWKVYLKENDLNWDSMSFCENCICLLFLVFRKDFFIFIGFWLLLSYCLNFVWF